MATIDYTLQLLHFSDGEAGLLASTTAPNLAALVDAFDDSYANTLILSGGDNFLPGPFLAAGTDPSVISALNAATGSTVAAGANLPIAAVDIAIHNVIGVEASTIGNHEFDLGSNVLSAAMAAGSGWVGASFVYLSSNLDFSGDSALSGRYTETMGNGATATVEASTLKGRIAPAAVITEGGEKIGLIGVTTQIIEAISSPSGTEVEGFPTGPGANGETDDMVLLAAQLQPIIDEMRAEGIDKIILQSHLQVLDNERLLATLLDGVDIILAAGSNTRLGDADDVAVSLPGHGANFADTYPIVVEDAGGNNTLIVNTDNEYTYLGRLKVDFDADGNIIVDNLAADSAINGAYAATDENVAEAWGTTVDQLDETAFAEGTKGDLVRDLTGAVQNVIDAKDGTIFGYTSVYLEGERIAVRNQETNLGNLSADANAYAASLALGGAAPDVIVSIKNGGGIRAQIGTISAPDPVDGTVDKLPPPANESAGKPEGGVSQLDVENSLRFDNKLMAFDTTAAGLKAILEHGLATFPNQGRFPQIGGVSFSYDLTKAAGSRISDIALIDDDGNVLYALYDDGVLQPDAPANITVVTLNFLANGGDGYPMKANGENFRYLLNDGSMSAAVDEALDFTSATVIADNTPDGATLMGEQQAFREYMQRYHFTQARAFDEADTPESLDERIQNTAQRADSVLTGEDFTGTATADAHRGTAANDTIEGQDGNDRLFGLGGRDVISGGDGNDALFGGLGADTMAGGAGNDTYDVDNAGDVVDETDGLGGDAGGRDLVVASVDYTLGDFLENLSLAGTADIAGTGNALNNRIQGNGGDNILSGLDGKDYIIGGDGDDVISGGLGRDNLAGFGGADSFLFDVAPSLANADRIRDFFVGEDHVALDDAVFTALATIAGDSLSAAEFGIGAAATTADQRIVYDDVRGSLAYDVDGVGGARAVVFAFVEAGLALTAADFMVV